MDTISNLYTAAHDPFRCPRPRTKLALFLSIAVLLASGGCDGVGGDATGPSRDALPSKGSAEKLGKGVDARPTTSQARKLSIGSKGGAPKARNISLALSHRDDDAAFQYLSFDVNSAETDPGLEFEFDIPPSATLVVGDTTLTADGAGKGSGVLKLGSLLSVVEPEVVEKNGRATYEWRGSVPVEVDEGETKHAFDLEINATRYLRRRWSFARRDKPGLIPGDSAEGPRKGAVFVAGSGYQPIGDTVERAADVDILVFEDYDKTKKGRKKKCGPYGKRKSYLTIEFHDAVLEARDIRTGEKLGTKTIKAASSKCPKQKWASTAKLISSTNSMALYEEPSVRKWVERLLD